MLLQIAHKKMTFSLYPLTYFMPLVSFYTPRKHQKIFGFNFLVFFRLKNLNKLTNDKAKNSANKVMNSCRNCDVSIKISFEKVQQT